MYGQSKNWFGYQGSESMKDLSFEARLCILLAVMAVVVLWTIDCVWNHDCPYCHVLNASSYVTKFQT
jgi:hypothetical protein